MAKIYVATKHREIAYSIDGGDGRAIELPVEVEPLTMLLTATVWGVSEFSLMWQKELDARQYDGLSDEELTKVTNPAVHTKRELPKATAICIDNPLVHSMLIGVVTGVKRHQQLVKQVLTTGKNLSLYFVLIPEQENLARKELH